MDQPWGLSGPQFLAVYAIGFVAVLVLMFVLQAIVARAGGASGADGSLDTYQAAYLAGGWRRVVDTAIAGLALRDQVLVSRGGRLTLASGAIGDTAVEAAVCGALAATTSRSSVYRRVRRHPAVLAVERQVRSRGLLLDAGRRIVWRFLVLLPVSAFAVGVARAVNGQRLHRPINNLLVLLFFSFIVLVWVLVARLRARGRLSAAGRAALRPLRAEHRSRGARDASLQFQLAGVAVLGFTAIADPSLRTALITSPSSGSSSGGSDGGSSCGGGGCGGGGCGGGGCGG
jgi:uncharacterized protein (TIGR04222 family)